MTATLIADRYEVLDKLGEGGMGAVYKVRHTTLQTILALKMMPRELAESRELVARFEREARVMAQLKHDNIVRVFDMTRDGDLYYLIEEFFDGSNLSQFIKSRWPLPFPQLFDIARQVASALEHAHHHGVVHRDIKPANILVQEQPALKAVVTDFGIAKVMDVDVTNLHTQADMILGTIKYAAPEQLGYRPNGRSLAVDTRADIYALGSVIYEMCEGKQLHDRRSRDEIMALVLDDDRPLVPAFSRPVPAELIALIERALQRDPDHRPRSMTEVMAELDRCLKPASAPPGPSAPTAGTIPATASVTASTDSGAESDAELEARIRALEQERQRRLAWAAQGEAEQARQEAFAAEAPSLAESAFRQGQAQEELAGTALREGRFLRARDLFERAQEVFRQAAEEARNALGVQEAEQARNAMLQAKHSAERHQAPERARSLFGSAAELEAEAEDYRNQHSYDEAKRSFLDAHRLYEGARDHAVSEAQREAATRIRTMLQEAKTAIARDTTVAETPTEATTAAAQLETRAEEALRAGRLDEAHELAAAAARAYEAAARELKEQRLREGARVARDQAERAQRAASETHAAETAARAYQEAMRVWQRGDQAFAARQYEAAQTLFDQAAASFARAVTESTQTREHSETQTREREGQRRRADDARANAVAAREAADNVDSARYSPESYRKATAALEMGDASDDPGAALRDFERATELYSAAAEQAVHEREVESVDGARAATLEAEQLARRHGALGDLQKEFEHALRDRKAADAALDSGDLSAARLGFESTADMFRRVADEFERRAEEVRHAQRDAAARQERAAALPIDQRARARIGDLMVAGERCLKSGQLAKGLERYREAVEQIDVAVRAAAERAATQGSQAVADPLAVAAADDTDATEVTPKPVAARAPWNDRRVRALGFLAVAGALTLAWYTLSPTPQPQKRETPNRPPSIAAGSPDAASVELAAGGSQRFSVTATDPDLGSGDQLTYFWERNGSVIANGLDPSWTLDAAQPTDRDVRVTAVDRAGQSSQPRTWRLSVTQVPPPKLPPSILSGSPAGDTISIIAGAAQRFSVTAADPDLPAGGTLTYTWERNGAAAAAGPDASYVLPRAERSDREIRVTVTDSAGLRSDSRTWTLAIADPPAPKPEPAAADLPPRIVSQRPPTGRAVQVEEGRSVDFSVAAEAPNPGERLSYAWRLDGEITGRAKTWRFTAPPAGASAASFDVALEVTDSKGLAAAPLSWRVQVNPVPPRIVEFAPAQKSLALNEGESATFSVTTRSGAQSAPLRHEWRLDGQPVATPQDTRYALPSTLPLGTHVVAVEAIDGRGLRSAPQRWTVALRREVAAIPPAAERAPQAVSESDVREWLAAFERAWESKDTAALRALGVVSSDEEEKRVKKLLAPYQRLEVSLSNEKIRLNGSAATVSFDRRDSDETGQSLPHPRTTYTLERGARGLVATGAD